MRRLSPAAEAAAQRWCAASATPYGFAALAAEAPRNALQAATRCDELALRMAHQLERLRAASSATNASGSYAGGRGPARALDVLLALHTDTLQQLHDFGAVVERLRERGLREHPMMTNEPLDGNLSGDIGGWGLLATASKYRQDEGEALRTLMVDLEGRHAVAAETVGDGIGKCGITLTRVHIYTGYSALLEHACLEVVFVLVKRPFARGDR
jgi:hypothetical protein